MFLAGSCIRENIERELAEAGWKFCGGYDRYAHGCGGVVGCGERGCTLTEKEIGSEPYSFVKKHRFVFGNRALTLFIQEWGSDPR
jgi:hypothetical protein